MSTPFMIMAGGTGGHVFPAIAVANALRERGHEVVWLGTRGGMEQRLVAEAGYPGVWVTLGGLRGKNLLTTALFPLKLALACLQALVGVLRYRPRLMLGFGGYAAFPGALVGKLLGRKLVVHEQNAVAGLTNRALAMFADRVLTGFPGAFEAPSSSGLATKCRPPAKTEWVGNPVRASILSLGDPVERFEERGGGRLRILVVGGSLGAQALNRALPAALALIPKLERPFVFHQAGDKHIDGLRHAYDEAGVMASCVPFIKDMAMQYAMADLVICRAGALTVAELATVGVGALLIPFPYAVDDHQTANARVLVEAGAARLLPERELTPEGLAALLQSLTREELAQMAVRAQTVAKPEATATVARIVLETAGLPA
ncbi:MAG: undecaprenyldiphospho-muramoylpentapeptide beta-N-acetylglucosaminyltransferase [Burkholderiales bacterium]|nr:undecaprenyldiphospho-muramoylpentapeptide beta-N-acetylglucosaminyltransferase [Burkholderiales bacterium]